MKNISIYSKQNAIIKRTLNLEEFTVKYLNPSTIKYSKKTNPQSKNSNEILAIQVFQ